MLIEFRVSNYRSFDEEVVFSMAAAPRLKKKENTFQPNLKDDPLPPLLKTAAIYGPNASGKSNFVRALSALKAIVVLAKRNGNPLIDVQPNKVRSLAGDSISKFVICFFHEDVRYELGVWATSKQIHKEWLIFYPEGKKKPLYNRTYSASTKRDEYVFGESLDGGQELHQFWIKTVAPQTLFLSQVTLNSSTEFQQLRKPFAWFADVLHIVERGAFDFERAWSTSYLLEAEGSAALLDGIAKWLSSVDIPVESIKIKRRMNAVGATIPEVSFIHNLGGNLIEFDLADESEGTQNLFSIASTWLLTEDGESPSVLIFDEFDSSLHPSILAKLVAQQCINSGGAQFIFTAHDTHLMDAKILRRDQFWLLERDRKGASKLSSIYDYVGREGEDLEKRYYEGRYRALPILID